MSSIILRMLEQNLVFRSDSTASHVVDIITHHQQSFYENARELLEHESAPLSGLIGLQLRSAWLARDLGGEWFNDEPAVLQLGNQQVEIGVYQIGLLAITWNTVDVRLPANWLGCWDWPEDDLHWHAVAEGPLGQAMGRRVLAIRIVEHDSPDFGCGVHAIEFRFDIGAVSIYNAGDELGISNSELDGPRYRHYRVG